jgi:hypothetical protein
MTEYLEPSAPERDGALEIEITSEMIAAGEQALLCELGGAVSSHWSAPDLAIEVYLAMASCSPKKYKHP